ncbi:MAG: N-acetylneuraminate synthase family protein, partial [Bacteriovoracaceae bacterium]
LVNMQAFDPNSINGSMPREFYKQCHFEEDDLIRLFEFAEACRIELFFSIFSKDYPNLYERMKYRKLSASQAFELGLDITYYDHKDYFISVPVDMTIPKIYQATILHVNNYCIGEDHDLNRIHELQEKCYQKVGLSDHSLTLDTCLKAIKHYGVETIEKHFCLEQQKNNIYFKGQLFRDSVHSATPKEFELLAKELKK